MMHIVIRSCAKTLLMMMAFLRLAIIFLKLIHILRSISINVWCTREHDYFGI